MKLFHWPMSHNARKARALARHLNLGVEEVELSMANGDHKQPAFLAINPLGQVPTLVDDDRTVWEAGSVLVHLAARAGSSLWPADPLAQAEVVRWLVFDASDLNPAIVPVHVEHYFKRVRNVPRDPAAGEAAMAKLVILLDVLEAHLKSRRYLLGSEMTIADFAVACGFSHAGPAGFPLATRPAIREWLSRMDSLAAMADTRPPVLG
jgi:glutathione S-transferase